MGQTTCGLEFPGIALGGTEINAKAQAVAASKHAAVTLAAAQTSATDQRFDLVFTSGVLIHINPDDLPAVYHRMLGLSRRYMMVCEYYNPVPTTVTYRGQANALFKRDFAGELMARGNLSLVDYGFWYQGDPLWPADDFNWFLMQQNA